MRVVAVSTEKVGPLASAGKVSRPFPMDTGFPAPVHISVTFAAEAVAFSKLNEFAIVESQFIAVPGIMTIKAPPHGLRMVQHDIGMLFL